jgi:hypothetical protein
VSDADMQAQKQSFRASEVKTVIKSFDQKLETIFSELYERSIDFGGHPNPHGTFSTVTIETKGPDAFISTAALITDPMP